MSDIHSKSLIKVSYNSMTTTSIQIANIELKKVFRVAIEVRKKIVCSE